MRNLSSKKWSLLAVLMVSTIANLSAVPLITAQTNPPESSAQLAELEEAEQLDDEILPALAEKCRQKCSFATSSARISY